MTYPITPNLQRVSKDWQELENDVASCHEIGLRISARLQAAEANGRHQDLKLAGLNRAISTIQVTLNGQREGLNSNQEGLNSNQEGLNSNQKALNSNQKALNSNQEALERLDKNLSEVEQSMKLLSQSSSNSLLGGLAQSVKVGLAAIKHFFFRLVKRLFFSL
jgi:chromosome segregation ATPase